MKHLLKQHRQGPLSAEESERIRKGFSKPEYALLFALQYKINLSYHFGKESLAKGHAFESVGHFYLQGTSFEGNSFYYPEYCTNQIKGYDILVEGRRFDFKLNLTEFYNCYFERDWANKECDTYVVNDKSRITDSVKDRIQEMGRKLWELDEFVDFVRHNNLRG